MTTAARQAPAVGTRESPAGIFDFIYALILIGAGLLAVAALLFGITHQQSPGGMIWVLVGLAGYLAVWGWGIRLASKY